MNFAQVIAAVAGLIAPAIQVVQSVEAAVPAGTKGSDKLAMVKNTLISAESVVEGVTPVVMSVWPVLEQLIAAAVAAFNAAGLFKRSTPPA